MLFSDSHGLPFSVLDATGIFNIVYVSGTMQFSFHVCHVKKTQR